jgi:hypothetical protein
MGHGIREKKWLLCLRKSRKNGGHSKRENQKNINFGIRNNSDKPGNALPHEQVP